MKTMLTTGAVLLLSGAADSETLGTVIAFTNGAGSLPSSVPALLGACVGLIALRRRRNTDT